MSTMTIGGVTFTAPRNATEEAANFADKQDENNKKDALAAENVGKAYASRTGKSGGRLGEKKIIIPKDAKALAKELGVAIPNTGWTGNKSSVHSGVKKFNDELAAAVNEKAEAEASAAEAAEAPAEATDAFDIDVGDGETVEAADPADFNINAEMAAPIEADNTAATFDDVVTGPGDAADNSSTNTLMTGTFDDNYVAGTETVAAALNEGASAADAIEGTSIDAGQTSAISGIVDQALATENSTGAAEDEAIADYTSGTRGTIMTSPQGLLSDESDVFSTENLEDDPFLRPNRSLSGGLLY